MSQSERWATQSLPDGTWVRKDFSELSILIMNYHEEWRVAFYPSGAPDGLPASGSASTAPDDVTWERWDHDPKDTQFCFHPTFPSLPVIARPHNILNLSPEGKAEFFIGIPAQIDVRADCQGKMISLREIPTATLSHTWHGTPLEGKPSYALRTSSRRVFIDDNWPSEEIICPINIVNNGSFTLPFERLYLETDHLSIFEKDSRLWSNAARIRVAAKAKEMSNVTYSPRPASPYHDAVEITEPRKGRIRQSTLHSAFAKVLGQMSTIEE